MNNVSKMKLVVRMKPGLFLLSSILLPLCYGPRGAAGSDMTLVKTTLRLFQTPANVDFNVPKGVDELEIWLEYPEWNPETEHWGTISAKLLAPPDVVRGSSIGWAESIFLREEEASPGFLPGPLTAGSWRLTLSSRTSGIRCNVEVKVRDQQASHGPKWFRGDFHIHNEHSDGSFSLATIVARARAASLDFAVVTEHNTSSHHREIGALPSKISLLLPGEEITTPSGHANALGLPPGVWIDFRIDGSLAGLERLISETHKAGALFSINHPFRGCCVWKLEIPKTVDCIEVWNGGVGDGLWDSSDEKAVAWWDSLLAKGLTTTAIGGSDCHFTADVKWVGKDDSGRPGRPTTWVQADSLDTPAILKGVRAGRVFITAGPVVSPVSFLLRDPGTGEQAGIGETLLVTRGEMEIEVAFEHPAPVKIKAIAEGKPRLEKILLPGTAPLKVRIPAQGPYLRLEITDQQTGAMLALTNPIWIRNQRRTPDVGASDLQSPFGRPVFIYPYPGDSDRACR